MPTSHLCETAIIGHASLLDIQSPSSYTDQGRSDESQSLTELAYIFDNTEYFIKTFTRTRSHFKEISVGVMPGSAILGRVRVMRRIYPPTHSN